MAKCKALTESALKASTFVFFIKNAFSCFYCYHKRFFIYGLRWRRRCSILLSIGIVLYFIFFFFFLLLLLVVVSLSIKICARFSSLNASHRFETLTQCAELFQFVVDYLFRWSDPLTLFHCASICEGGLGSRNSVRPSVCHTRGL